MAQRQTPPAVSDWVDVDDWQDTSAQTPPPLPDPIGGLAENINKETIKPSSYNPAGLDLLAGVGSEVFSTGLGVSKLLNRATGGRIGHDPSTPLESVPLFGERYNFAPQNTMQKVGKVGAQIAEVALPTSAASKLVQGPGFLRAAARTGLEGATVGAVRSAQTGDPVQGAKEGVIAAATGGVIRAIPPLVQRAKVALAGGPQNYIEQQLAGGTPVKAITERGQMIQKVTPELAQNPAYLQAKNIRFQQKAFEDFNAAKHGLKAAEGSLNSTLKIPRDKIIDFIDDKIAELQVPGRDELLSGAPEAVRELVNARNTISKLHQYIPVDDAIKLRRQLDNAIQVGGGFKETSTAAERALMQARRDVSNAVRGEIAAVDGGFRRANEAFSKAADVMDAGQIDWNTGRVKLGELTKVQQLKNVVKRGAGTAAVGAGGYAAYKALE